MGKPLLPELIARTLIALVIVVCLANGAFMIGAPLAWYHALPTVPATGPANPHFIVDIGLAYLCSGAVLFYGVLYPEGRWLALVAGALWLTLHGAFHMVELADGTATFARFKADAPGVLGPPSLVWCALAILMVRQRITPAGLPRRLFLSVVDRRTPDESSYFHEIARAPGHALEKFMHFMPATMHRHTAPPDIFHLTRIGATLVEDCGPCALTAANSAMTEGVGRELINAALSGGHRLVGDQFTAFRFGQAIAGQSPDAFTLGDTIEHKFGRHVRLELAMTAALVRGYPAMKRGLGLSKSCAATQLRV